MGLDALLTGLAGRPVTAAQPAATLPDFTGDDYGEPEGAVLALVLANREQLADIEQTVQVASAGSGNRKLLARIIEYLSVARCCPSRMVLLRNVPGTVQA